MQMYLCGSGPWSATVRTLAALARPAPGAGFRCATNMAVRTLVDKWNLGVLAFSGGGTRTLG
jgi:hypothetical protein